MTLLALKTARGEKRKGSIAVPVTASRAVEEMARAYGFGSLRTKTTSRGIMEAATSEDVVFVGEDTGGYIFPRFQPVFDGMYAVVKILEMIAREGVRLHTLVREVPPSRMVREKVACSWEQKGMIMRRLAEDSGGERTTLIDGIKINFGSDWVIA